MVSSQMHWSLVIQRTEESIRFSLELNWINLSRFSSRTSLPIWEKNGQAVHVHVQYPVFFFIFLMEVAPFGFLCSYKERLTHALLE